MGMEVARDTSVVVLTQRKYALDMLHDFGFTDSKPASIPFNANLKYHVGDSEPLSDN